MFALKSLAALAAVCALAWVVLRWSARRLGAAGAPRRMRVLERLSLDARRTLYLVDLGGKVLLIGAGEGPLTTLSEIDPAAFETGRVGGLRQREPGT